MRLWVLTAFLLIHSITDLREEMVYDAVWLFQTIMGILFFFTSGGTPELLRFIWGVLFLLLSRIKEAAGEGDGLVLLSLGLYLNGTQMTVVMAGACTAALFAGIAAAFFGKKRLPFMPFLLGGVLCLRLEDLWF